ncbi:MAG: hypothetical protein M3Q06_03405 [Bacteroidota bacterium]|nr:hypothetical protein [Bacteroidota bacterium]
MQSYEQCAAALLHKLRNDCAFSLVFKSNQKADRCKKYLTQQFKKLIMKSILSSVIAFVALFSVSTAVAQSPHFVKGPDGSISGTNLVFNGKIAGLGSGDVTVVFEGTATADVQCTNPGGQVVEAQGTTIPGVTASKTLTVQKNGTTSLNNFTVPVTLGNTNPCPNGNWTPSITRVTGFSGTMTVYDAQGNPILSEPVSQ